MSTPSLRGLAKAYSDGLIDRKQYLRARRQIIDDVVSGAMEIVAFENPAPAPTPVLERTFSDPAGAVERAQSGVAGTAPANASAKSKWAFIIAAVLALAAFGGAAWFKLNGSPDPVRIERSITVADETKGANPAEDLLVNFLDENQWRAEHIDAFVLAWQKIPPSSRHALADGPSMHRAAAAITQKINDENALLGLGEHTAALEAQRRLLDLAAALPLYNERFARLEREWRDSRMRIRANEQAVAEQHAPPAASNTTSIAPVTATPNAAAAVAAPISPAPEPPIKSALTPATVHNEPVNGTAAFATATEKPTTRAVKDGASTAQTQRDTSATTPANALGDTPIINASGAPRIATDTPDVEPAQSTISRPDKKPRRCRAALAKQRRSYCHDTLADKSKGPALVVLPPGHAEIGGRNPEEQPRRIVTIERPFALGIYEISNKEFEAFCTATDRACPPQPWSNDPELPVVNISWTLATEYTQWLTEMTGARYRLPSESEWEYAARAGTNSIYPFGDEILPTHARFSFRKIENSPLEANDRSVNRNKFRLYHMVGNVREWVLAVWHENHGGAPSDGSARTGKSNQRVVRGGSYLDGADRIRSASRMHLAIHGADGKTGFRILREID